ncbi:MAG TPA: L-lactate dehydrogenase [Anaerolineaceae bacterium]
MVEPLKRKPTRVAVVGAGFVGTTFAYALLLSGLASEIVLIDANQAKAEGEAMDLNHAVPLAQPGHVWAGKYADCAGAAITVVTAGSAQRPGETRLDLTTRNTEIFRQIIPQIAKHNPEGILLIATNPVDVLTYASQKFSGLSPRQVFGSGTILDTARFRYLLSQHFGVDARSVHAYIIGEHGDSEVPVWSLANIAGMHIPEFCAFNGYNCNDPELENIFERTRDAAYQIISRKGATYYAIGSGLLRIVEAVLRDQNTVLSISSLIEDYYGLNDVCFSLPTIIDRGGVERVLHLELDPTEIEGLRSSAEVLKSTIKSLHL